ncbi:MAG TPA: ABC transporter substrate-binding protein [Streptosporangiaceae bacterium]
MRLSSARISVSEPRTSPRRLRPIAVLLAGLAAAAGISGCNPLSSQATPTDSPVVTVGVVPGIDNATLFLAKKRGYFTRAGIDVRIKNFSTVAAELRALSAGQVNVAAGDYGDLFARQSALQKDAYKILADGYDAAPGVVQIMTMPDSPITSPNDLRVIGAPNVDQVSAPRGGPNSLVIASATSVLQSYGVNLSNLTWRNMSETDEISQLVSGKLKAVLLTQPYVYQAQQQGAVELLDACSGATAGIPLSGYFTSTSWSQNNGKEVAAFRAGLAEADAQASMPGPVQSVLPMYAKLTKEEAALVTTGVYPLSTITANLQRTADLMNVVGMIKRQLNVAKMIAK